MIISVGYRVHSIRGVQFRMWATQTLKEYLIKVSFHVSRHSFAFQALQADIDPMTIKGALAHGSLLTTETYLKDFDNSEVDTTIQKMFDKSYIKEKAVKLLLSLSEDERKEVIERVISKANQPGV